LLGKRGSIFFENSSKYVNSKQKVECSIGLIILMLAEEIMILSDKERDGQKLCVIGRYLTDLDEPYGSALQKIVNQDFADGGLTEFAVAMVMNEAGLKGSPTSVLRHRRKLCICQKKDTHWKRTL
jgi:hypothetical protein